MSELMARRPLHLKIEQVVLTAASAVEARRLADALPAALQRAFSPPAATLSGGGRSTPADTVAREIVLRVSAAAAGGGR